MLLAHGQFPEVIARLREVHNVDSRKALLVGISSGSSAALAITAKTPEHYLGVIAVPGRLWEENNISQFGGLPVFLRVGANDDFFWYKKLDTHSQLLRQAGVKVDAALIPNANHTSPLDWNELEQWLGALPQPD